MNTLPRESVQKQVWAYLDGQMEESAMLDLQRQMKSDPSLRRFYLRCVSMQSNLHWEHSSMEGETFIPQQVRQSGSAKVLRPTWELIEKSGAVPIGIAAAFIGVIALLGVRFLQQEEHAVEHAARIEAQWSEQALGIEAGEGHASLVFGNAPSKEDADGLIVPASRDGEAGHSLLFRFQNPGLREG